MVFGTYCQTGIISFCYNKIDLNASYKFDCVSRIHVRVKARLGRQPVNVEIYLSISFTKILLIKLRVTYHMLIVLILVLIDNIA